MRRRVVITGMGAVTPLGNDVPTFWQGLREGRCGIGPITHYDTSSQKVKLAGEVKDLPVAEYIDAKAAKRMDPFTQFAIIAAKQAYQQAGLTPENVDAERFGVLISSGIGGLNTIETEMRRGLEKGFDRVSPFFVPMNITNLAAGNVAIELGAKGMCSCVVTACAGGTNAIGDAFRQIFVGAFSPAGVTGGACGSMILCITWGVKRGVFSNEAGLGSAPMAHATTSETDPVKQGVYGIFEVFVDTIIICTLSGLTILCAAKGAGLDLNYGTEGDTGLNVAAFGTVFGDQFGSLLIAVGLALFAYSTVLGWALYGTRACEFIFGAKAIRPYQIIFIIIIVVGATMDLGLAWDIADTLNGLMAIPNLIAVIALSGVVVRETKRHFANKAEAKKIEEESKQ